MLARVLKAWLPAAIMCVVIFLFSQDANSGRHSDTVLGWLLTLVGSNTPHLHRLLDAPFRKFAHVVVYFLLGVFSYHGFAAGQRHFAPAAALRSLIFCAVYAATDEYHQRFIHGRGPAVHDVVLDTAAAALALFCIWMFTRKPRTPPTLMAAVPSGE